MANMVLEWNDLAILNLQITPMPPTKVRLNRTYHSGAGCLKIFKMAIVAAILDIRME